MILSNLLAISAALFMKLNPSLDNNQLSAIRSNLLQSANASWELGTAAEALTEYSWPSLSVFSPSAFPPPTRLNATLNASDVLSIAQRVVSSKKDNSLPLISDQGSAADPASIGPAVLLANWTRTDPLDKKYTDAAGSQLGYLLSVAPRSKEGAISHRVDQVQLWADFVYMVPPFIAYFGSLEGGEGERNLLQIAYDQCRLYRDALRDENGLWRHIAQGSWQDNAHWATGNAWAAAGMLRVHQTMNHTGQANLFQGQQANLTTWIQDILVNSWKYQQNNGTLLNVLDDPKSFADSASTALLASVTYRMAVIAKDASLIPFANKALKLIHSSVDAQGWLQNTVDPLTFNTPSKPGAHSPEGQAFVLLLHAAWRAYAQHISKP
ncbi:Six-hairpin glycosidase-like protein [Infundibulicybe gibba]|nr:Six-hairpin glycosidase-like protein [Infundibulicybe gibba]